MPCSQFAQMQAAKKRAAKLVDKGRQIDFKELLGWSRTAARRISVIATAGTRNAGSVSSPDALCHSHPSVNSIKLRGGDIWLRPRDQASGILRGNLDWTSGKWKKAKRPTTYTFPDY
jgi:hypothetical protein